jgi:hypothetical protein
MNAHKSSHEDQVDAALSARIREIRARLPHQLVAERLEMATASYGRLYTVAEASRLVAETLPRRFAFVRGAQVDRIEQYTGRIPDEVLLKYDDAVETQLFSTFWVVTPTYYSQRQQDPWLLGQISGSTLCVVIAQWDDPITP